MPLFPRPPVPSLSMSESKQPLQPSPPTSPVRTPLEVRLFPQLQTYVPYRPHPPQLRKVTSPLQSPTKTKPKAVSTDDQKLSIVIASQADAGPSLSLGQLLLGEKKLLGKLGKTEPGRVLSHEQLRSSRALPLCLRPLELGGRALREDLFNPSILHSRNRPSRRRCCAE